MFLKVGQMLEYLSLIFSPDPDACKKVEGEVSHSFIMLED
jgi:hypothetical protein